MTVPPQRTNNNLCASQQSTASPHPSITWGNIFLKPGISEDYQQEIMPRCSTVFFEHMRQQQSSSCGTVGRLAKSYEVRARELLVLMVPRTGIWKWSIYESLGNGGGEAEKDIIAYSDINVAIVTRGVFLVGDNPANTYSAIAPSFWCIRILGRTYSNILIVAVQDHHGESELANVTSRADLRNNSINF